MYTDIVIEKHEKILDGLAEILECRSACVSLACVNDRFLITANEFTNNTADTIAQQRVIYQIMQYFQAIASTGALPSAAQRDDLMLNICKLRLSSLGKGHLDLDDEAIKVFVNSARMVDRGYPPQLSECQELTGSNIFTKVCAAYGNMQGVHRSIKKIEKGIHKATNGDHTYITPEQLNAFKYFEDNNILCKTQNERLVSKSIHAELQILTELVKSNANTATYVAVSKRCCFDCHCTIDAANIVFERTGFPLRIKTRNDAHDGAEKNFYFPEVLFDSNPFLKEIQKEYTNLLLTRKSVNRFPTHQHPDSASEASENEQDKKIKYERLIAERGKTLDELKENPDTTIGMHLEVLNLVKSLNQLGIFDMLFKIDSITEESELQDIVNAFFQKYVEHQYDLDHLQRLLKLNYFPKIYENHDQQANFISYIESKLKELQSAMSQTVVFNTQATPKPKLNPDAKPWTPKPPTK